MCEQTSIQWLRMMAEHSNLTDCKSRFREIAWEIRDMLDALKDAGNALTDLQAHAYLRGQITAIVKRVEGQS